MIVAGFGFRGAATLNSLQDAYAQATSAHTADALSTVSDKTDHPAFTALASTLSLPVKQALPQALTSVSPLTNSDASQTARGTGSVAEASALVAAGKNSVLIQTRVISKDRLATCALATSRPDGDQT